MTTIHRRPNIWQGLICVIVTLIGLMIALVLLLPLLLGEIAGSLVVPQLIEWLKTVL